jgi:hypothetical protein
MQSNNAIPLAQLVTPMQSNFPVILSQLLALSPQLLVYIGGMVLAAVWWRRAPSAAMLTLLGLGLMLLSALAGSAMTIYLVTNRASSATFQMSGILSLALAVVRAVGIGLLVAAVFSGRARVSEGRAFEVQNVGAGAM